MVPALVSWLPAVAYCAVIAVLSSIPSDAMPAGSWWRFDKLIHVAEYSLLGALLTRAFLRGPPRLGLVAAALVATLLGGAYGVSDEWHQSFTPGRYASAYDAMADLVGAALGSATAASWYRRRAGSASI